MQSRVPGVPHSGRSFPQSCSCQLLAKLDGSPWVKAATRACLMLLTAVFALSPHTGAQVVPLYPAYQFAAPGGVGAAAATGTVLVTASANGSLSAIRVLTQGIPNQDFTLAAGGSCAVGTAYFTGQSCTVTVSFQPKYPGLRQGAVVLLASDGNVLGSELLEATGVGATAVFVPGMISTVAGNGQWIFRGDGGLATQSPLFLPIGGAADAAGNLILSDSNNQRIRMVNAATGMISTVAGNGTPGFGGDGGPATSAQLANCEGIAQDSAGNLYVADTFNRRIRKITPAGIISTVAGNGLNSFSGDGGPAINAALGGPEGVAVDSQGNLYIADTLNQRVRKVSSSGVITTIAGDGIPGYTGDGVPSNASQLNTPRRVVLDSAGNIYIADSGNNVVRKIAAATGIIRTVAGNTTNGYSGDGGPATAAALSDPHGMAVDASGALLIADSGNRVIRRVDSNGVITTIAGNGSATLSGDGRSPLNTGFGFPVDVSLDAAGNIYIADRANARVRRIQPAPASLVVSQTGLTFSAAVDAAAVSTRTIRILNGGAGTIGWSAIASTVSGGPNWLAVSPAQGSSTSTTAGLLTVAANPAGLAAGNYYGRIQIVSPGVTNSPRFLTVVLNVLSAAQTAGAAVNSAGLVFTGTAGGANPAAQTLTVSKLHGAGVAFTSSISFDQPGQWIAATPGTAIARRLALPTKMMSYWIRNCQFLPLSSSSVAVRPDAS